MIEKRQPGGSLRLRCTSEGDPGGEFGVAQAVDGLRVRYEIEDAEGRRSLSHLQWAEWDHDGRLLAATRDGHLQHWDLSGPAWALVCDIDLTACAPDPTPAPSWARRW
jgi:hypothetical protein